MEHGFISRQFDSKIYILSHYPGGPQCVLHSRHLESFKNTPSKRAFNTLNCDLIRISLVALTVKHLSTMQETWVQALVGKIPWRRKWQSTPVLLPGESHGQRSQLERACMKQCRPSTTEKKKNPSYSEGNYQQNKNVDD